MCRENQRELIGGVVYGLCGPVMNVGATWQRIKTCNLWREL